MTQGSTTLQGQLPIVAWCFPLLALFTIFWVGCLVHAARRDLWTWFVVMLVLPLAAILYPIAGREAANDGERRKLLERREDDRRVETTAELSRLRRRVEELERRATP